MEKWLEIKTNQSYANLSYFLCLLNICKDNFVGKVPSVKVVASGGKTTTNVTKGFDISQKDTIKLNTTPRSQSPASGRGTPVISQVEPSTEESKSSKNKDNKINVEAQYKKERGDSKDHLYMVVIGHVDAGKSTLMGHLLYDLGQVCL